jgi:hypothetical protein
MRVCYFVQTHRDPVQIARLVSTLVRASPSSLVLVGHDGRGTGLARADLPAVAGVELFQVEGPVERGRLSLLAPYFQALAWLGRERVEYDWLVYLSGQDYPTAPLARLEARLATTDFDGFLRHWRAFDPVNPWGRKRQGILRYAYRYAEAPAWAAPLLRVLRRLNGVQSLVHVHLTYGRFVGLRLRRTPFGPARVCWAGTQWTTLRRACVEHLAERLGAERELLAHYARTICADESLVQTLLVNGDRFRFADDDLHYADCRGTRTGSPRTLTTADLGTLADPRYHFARKFDRAVDAAVLDRLDERIFPEAARSTAGDA